VMGKIPTPNSSREKGKQGIPSRSHRERQGQTSEGEGESIRDFVRNSKTTTNLSSRSRRGKKKKDGEGRLGKKGTSGVC